MQTSICNLVTDDDWCKGKIASKHKEERSTYRQTNYNDA